MITKQHLLVCCATMILNISVAQAGPCNTGSKTGQDAGSGTTVGATGQATGTASPNAGDHSATDRMNRATGDTAASSQDAQRQMQGQPTAAQQAQGVKPSAKMADDQGC